MNSKNSHSIFNIAAGLSEKNLTKSQIQKLKRNIDQTNYHSNKIEVVEYDITKYPKLYAKLKMDRKLDTPF